VLKISVTRGDEEAQLCLNGRITIDSSPALREKLRELLSGEPLENLTVDLSDVPYMDLSGIATLLEALKIARSRKTGLQLAG
jgi:anti-anti-sigma factor